MREDYTISCILKCNETFYKEFEEFKQKLNNLSPVSKPLHNTEVFRYVLKEFMDNFDNKYKAEKKIEWIKEILNK